MVWLRLKVYVFPTPGFRLYVHLFLNVVPDVVKLKAKNIHNNIATQDLSIVCVYPYMCALPNMQACEPYMNI